MYQKNTECICPFYYMMRCSYPTIQTIMRDDIPDMAGDWCGYNQHVPRRGPASIIQEGNKLLLISEIGTKSNGYFLDNRTIVATDWGGLKGRISTGLKEIHWENDTMWTRGTCNGTLPYLGGAWCGYNKHVPRRGPASIIQQGNSLLFISEIRTRSNGYFLDNRTVVATDWENLIGAISYDLNTIFWQNDTTWTRGKCDSIFNV